MHTKKKIINDIILTVSVLLFALIVFLIFRLTMEEGAYASVTCDGVELGKYYLKEDKTVKLETPDKDGFNILVIKNGEAYIEDASCPDGICVAHRKIKYEGESIVCLPNGIVITVLGEGSAPDVDVVS